MTLEKRIKYDGEGFAGSIYRFQHMFHVDEDFDFTINMLGTGQPNAGSMFARNNFLTRVSNRNRPRLTEEPTPVPIGGGAYAYGQTTRFEAGFYIMSVTSTWGQRLADIERGYDMTVDWKITSPAPVPVPLPAALLLTGIGGLGLVARRRRRG